MVSLERGFTGQYSVWNRRENWEIHFVFGQNTANWWESRDW